MSGIFSAPVSGAKKGGMGGFFKGVGKGLVGAVVKPVVGVTDSVISVAQVWTAVAELLERVVVYWWRRLVVMDASAR